MENNWGKIYCIARGSENYDDDNVLKTFSSILPLDTEKCFEALTNIALDNEDRLNMQDGW